MVPGNCCFYVYCVNFHFHRKKLLEKPEKKMEKSRADTISRLKNFCKQKRYWVN